MPPGSPCCITEVSHGPGGQLLKLACRYFKILLATAIRCYGFSGAKAAGRTTLLDAEGDRNLKRAGVAPGVIGKRWKATDALHGTQSRPVQERPSGRPSDSRLHQLPVFFQNKAHHGRPRLSGLSCLDGILLAPLDESANLRQIAAFRGNIDLRRNGRPRHGSLRRGFVAHGGSWNWSGIALEHGCRLGCSRRFMQARIGNKLTARAARRFNFGCGRLDSPGWGAKMFDFRRGSRRRFHCLLIRSPPGLLQVDYDDPHGRRRHPPPAEPDEERNGRQVETEGEQPVRQEPFPVLPG